jgi:glutamate/tyrosine decarboxylase-like PLP-dependent enzyme
MPLPPTGLGGDEVLARLDALAAADVDFAAGRAFSLVYPAPPEIEQVIAAAHDRYVWHNGLNPDAFPSLRTMQSDVVGITASLLGGDEVDDDLAGFMTSGGTESILMAVKAAKGYAHAERGVTRPNIVLPMSAHAAFDKACEYFTVEPRRVAVRADWRADVDAMADEVDDDTALVVGSAPSYPQGVVDPIADIAAMASERGVNCHVDACMGGFALPFLERIGLFAKPWDFRVPGVTSMSADVHKYGYAPKGASVIVYRNKDLRRHQTFLFDGWLGGFYGSSGVAGTKPGGPIAAAWAALHHIGADGYERLVRIAYDARVAICETVASIEELAIVGEPEMTLAAIRSAPDRGVDVFAVGDALRRRGWLLDRQAPPESLHATCTPAHTVEVVHEFLAALRESVTEVRGTRVDDRSTNYAATE